MVTRHLNPQKQRSDTFAYMTKKSTADTFNSTQAIETNVKAIQIAFKDKALSRADRETLLRYEGFHFCPALWDERPYTQWDPVSQRSAKDIHSLRQFLKKQWADDYERKMRTLREASIGNLFMPALHNRLPRPGHPKLL